MNKEKFSKVLLPFSLLAAAVIVAAGFVFFLRGVDAPPLAQVSQMQEEEKEADETLVVLEDLKDVNFCGQIYKAKQVYINGVDVIQKIANIASKKPVHLICESVNWNASGNELKITQELLTYPPQKSEIYTLTLNSVVFSVNADIQTIAIVGAFDDTIIGFLTDSL